MRPRRLILELTDHCDLQCRYCSTASGPRGEARATVHFWTRLLRQFSRLGGEELVLSGGEPLLYPGLHALLREAHRAGFSEVTVLTNGMHCDPWVVRELAGRAGVQVLVSLDSLRPDSHELLRGPESHGRALGGLRQLREGLPGYRLGLAVTVTRMNRAELLELVSWAQKEGLGRLRWAEMSAIGRGRLVAELTPRLEELVETQQALQDACGYDGSTVVEYWGEADLGGPEPDPAVRVLPGGEVFAGRGPGAAQPLGRVRAQGLGALLLRRFGTS